MDKLVGRHGEKELLRAVLESDSPELVAVYGRRRVGKTFLIRNYCRDFLVFECSGVHEAGLKVQLQNFTLALQLAMKTKLPLVVPDSWLVAFHYFDQYLADLPADRPAVIFFDEFPWLHTQKSGFLQAFEHWWNSSASRHSHFKVIICGSAASWMIDKILNNKGGLHNRVTQRIRLLPFSLRETEEYLQSRLVNLDQFHLLQLYMAMGGIPYYLHHVKKGESSTQVIDRLCFTKDGILKQEFKNLYESLFSNAQHHETVVRELARIGKGLNRNEIIIACGFSSGGTTTRILTELEESGFISGYIPFEKNENDRIYKLTDEYSLFYLKFIEGARATGEGAWLRQVNNSSYMSWCGFAFESVCQKHISQIKKALGIEGVLTQVSAWRHIGKRGKPGTQIDLLLDRADRCINLCEIKMTGKEFTIDKKYAEELDNKLNVFLSQTGSKKTIFLTLVTTYGVSKNDYYTGRVQAEVKVNQLFT